MNNTENLNSANIRLKAVRRSYDFHQPEFPIGIKEYLLTNIEDQRCCIIRWVNKLDFPMDRLCFELIELDIDGDVLGRSKHTLGRADITPVPLEETFAADKAFPVHAKCAYVKVLPISISSGEYTYRMEPDGMEVDYRIEDNYWRYEEEHRRKPKPKRKTKKKKYRYVRRYKKRKIASKRGMRVRLLRLFVLLSLLLIAVVIISPLFEYIAPLKWLGVYFS